MAYTAYLNTVQEIYMAYLQRPADPAGLIYWATQLDNAGGNVNAILPYIAASQECQAAYGPINSSTISSVVNEVYNDLFNRNPDAGGLAFWVGEFNAGRVTSNTLEYTILYAALMVPQGQDAVCVNNKLSAANLFTSTIDPGLDNVALQATFPDNIPLNDLQYARTFLQGVSSVAGSIPSQAATTTFIQNYIGNPGDPIMPTFALSSSAPSVDEGNTVYFTLATTKVAEGNTYDYAITGGVNAADVVGGQMTGTATIGSDGDAIIPVTLAADHLTEGAETLTVTVAGKSASVTVIDTSITPTPTAILTPQADYVDFSTSGNTDTVRGYQGEDGTFTPGDYIKGNNLTVFDLIADGNDGGGVVATVKNLAKIDIYSVSDTTIEAVDFHDIGAINVTGGANGNWIGVEDLDMGTPIRISGVTGTISSSYDVPRVDQVNVWAYNGDINTTASALLDADGNLSLTLDDEGTGGAIFRGLTRDQMDGHGEVDLGTISVTAGDDTWSEVQLGRYYRRAETVDVFNVDVAIGDPSHFRLDVDATGDVNIGDASMVAGSSAQLYYSVSTPGDIDLDDIYMTAGYSSDVGVWAGMSDSASDADAHAGNIAIGDIYMEAGGYSSLDIWAGAYADGYYDADATVGNIYMGDVIMTAGYSSSLDLVAGAEAYANYTYSYGGQAYAAAGNITIGDIDMEADGYSSLLLGAGAGAEGYYSANATVGNIDMGAINMVAGYSSSVDLYAGAFAGYGYMAGDGGLTAGYAYADAGNINIDSINMVAGYSSSLELYAGAYADGYYDADAHVDNINIGNIDMVAGNWSDLYIDAGADASMWNTWTRTASASAGNITMGNISMEAGTSSSLELYVGAYAEGRKATATVGDIDMGNISMTAGDWSNAYISVSAWATAPVYRYAASGNISVGDIDVTIGSGYFDTVPHSRDAEVNIGNVGANGGDGVSVGNVTLTAGDYANVGFDVYNNNYWGNATLGDVEVGQVSVAAGTSADIYINVSNSLSNHNGSVGNLTVGGVDVLAAQDSDVDLFINQYANSGDVGNMNVGNIQIVTGDDLQDLDVVISSSANHGSAGTMTVGNISIAASATTTVDLSGLSDIWMKIDHHAYGSSVELLGAETIGDISMSVGDESEITLLMDQTGAAFLVDDYKIGAINLVAGNSSSAWADIDFTNYLDHGDLGDFSLTAFNATIGNSSDLDSFIGINLSKSNDGDLGNVTIGSVSLNVGNTSYADFSVDGKLADGDTGKLDFGNITVVTGKNADVDLWNEGPPYDIWVNGEISGIGFGNLSFTLGQGANVYFDPDIRADDDIGNISVGNITANLAKSATLSATLDLSQSSDIGNITIGNANIVMGENAHVDLEFQYGASDDIGLMKVGNISINAGLNSRLVGDFDLGASDDIRGLQAGNLSITAAAGSLIPVEFEINAGDEAGYLTAGNISIDAKDAIYAIGPDSGKHYNGARVYLDYKIYGNGDGDTTIGDISVTLAKLAKVDIDITSTNTGDLYIGNLTVSGAVGTETYATLPADSGYFHIADAVTNGEITIGNVDYRGYVGNIDIDMTWTQHGAANIWGNGSVNNITGNNAANTIYGGGGNDVIHGMDGNDVIWGGTGQDTLYGDGGTDTFAFQKGDSGPATNIDTIQDWTGTNESLKFGVANGSSANYMEGGSAPDIAAFLVDAANALDASVKFYAAMIGGDTYVAVNYGSGEADLVVELVGKNLGDIAPTNIKL